MQYVAKSLIAVLALLLLLPCAAHASSEGGSHGDSGKGEKKEPGKAENGVITIGPLTVNILSNKGYRFMRLAMQVECTDNAAAERLVKPDAREDLIFLLSNKLAEDLLSNSGKMVLRQELLDLFTKYAGPGKVKNIYFTEFVFQ